MLWWVLGRTLILGSTARIVTIIRRGVSLFIGINGTGGVAPRATIPHYGRELEIDGG